MSLYYNKYTLELRELQDSYVQELIENNNPKAESWVIAPEKPGVNYYWNNGEWAQKILEIPTSISARQIRLWLINNGIQLAQVDDAINSIEDPITRETVRVEWEYAPYVERNHPMLVPLAQALGLTELQIDQAFIDAQNI